MTQPDGVPHFVFPFRFAEGGVPRTVEQDTLEEIEQGVKVLMLTELGERLEVPGFGIADLTFQTDLDVDTVRAAAKEWDDRAEVVFAEDPDGVDGKIRNLLIQVTEEN